MYVQIQTKKCLEIIYYFYFLPNKMFLLKLSSFVFLFSLSHIVITIFHFKI